MIIASLFKLAACTKGGIAPGLYDNLPCDANGVTFTDLSQIWTVVANVVRILVALSGALAVIFIIVGGLFYVVSSGDPARIKRAKEILKESIIGLIITIVAYSAITFIAQQF
jgi:hypothetical protein